MRAHPTSAIFLIVAIHLLTAPAAVARLALPVWTPGSDVAAPCYRGDLLELQLRPAAARAVLPRGAGAASALPVGRLGLVAVDAVAASVGATAFEPEFPGVSAPEPGEGPDLTAFQVVHLAPGSDLEAALVAFRALPEVASADPIAVLPISSLPNDSLAYETYWLYRDKPVRTDIRAPEAWQVTTGDTAIVVGVIDTGINPWHPDLGGVGVERGQMWANWVERGGVPGVDDDGNGYVDDVAGWDFVVNGINRAVGEDGRDEDNDPTDWAGHGTAVAGVLGAIAGNGIGLAGVAHELQIMPLRIGWLEAGQIPPAGSVDMLYAARAIQYATRMGVSVINCSWTSVNTNGLDAAVTAATQRGMVVVNAAGNGGTPFTYLGERDDVISVSATDSMDVVWDRSNVAPWVDLSAGGVSITSTMFVFPRGATTDSLIGRSPGYRGFMNGTSFAAPQVAGAAVLLQAQRRSFGADPLTPAGMLLRLRETTDDILAQNPVVTGFGTGRLNLFRALTGPPLSLAVRGRARSVGPAVVLQSNAGGALVVYATTDRTIVAYDGASGDTAWVRPLPALPVGNLAAAQFGAPHGVLFAVATAAGTVFLVHDDGRPVPGWPVTAQAGLILSAGVALGDVNGDGVPEVVAGGTTIAGSRLWAWDVAGQLLPGFPFEPGVIGMSVAALADLDGQPGDEIAFTDGDGALRVVLGDGTELAGFPTAVSTATRAPVIARLGPPGTPPSIILASAGALAAYAPDGSTRWNVAVSGTPTQDPALGDLDGDGVDEIVLAMGTPTAIEVRDVNGASFTGRPGWPAALASPAQGPLVVGPLAAAHGPGVLFFRTAGLTALDDSAHVLATFPKPGGAGVFPSLGELDGDGATEVAAGVASADSNVYTYDAGAATWSDALAHWPTPRGDAARTASHANGTPGLLIADRVRPARVSALEALASGRSAVEVRYVATGDDSLSGTAARVILRRAPFPLDESNFQMGLPVPAPPPPPAGLADTVFYSVLPEASTWWFALRVVDDVGHMSAVSVSDSVTLPGSAPGAIGDLRALSVAESTVVLAWTSTGDDGDLGRPMSYRISASPQPLDASNVDDAPVQLVRPAFHDAGFGETTSVARLTPGRRWRFAVRGEDRTGTLGPISNVLEVVTRVGGAIAGRVGMALAPRPMPASADVVVDWQGDGTPGAAQWLLVYDLSGRERRRIALGDEPGGSYTWDGRDGDRRLLPAGLYFLRLSIGARHAQSRVVFIR